MNNFSISRGEKSQNLARHIALVHNKLDELLADEDLVEARRQEHLVTIYFRSMAVVRSSGSALGS